ncbi:polyprotein [Phytophthora megakarya]|uniref:Polyprotein n=1 Tax=Phytophthora megakarya TaxID=4795 RepID=A0A225V8X7_9STRA|nr:polyprotein [Phytophthora megakarya]
MPGNPEVEAVCVNDDPAVDYRQVVGSLQYLVQCTRPDIANAVRTLGKFLNCYTHEHNVLAKRVLRYLRGTSAFGLVWTMATKPEMQFTAYVNAWRPLNKEIQIMAYADADLGNEKDDR